MNLDFLSTPRNPYFSALPGDYPVGKKKLFNVLLGYCRLRQLPTLSPKLCFSSFTPGVSCFAKIKFFRATCSSPPIMLILVPCSFEDQGLYSWIIWSWFPALWVWGHHFSLLSQISPSLHPYLSPRNHHLLFSEFPLFCFGGLLVSQVSV